MPNATDAERFRWPNHSLWDAVARTISNDLAEMTTGAAPGAVKAIRREQLANTTEGMVKGLIATWTVTTETPIDANAIAAELARMAKEHVVEHGQKFQASRERSTKRYRFLAAD